MLVRSGVMYDALMRWEWEGGTPASVSDRGEAVPAEARREHSQSAAAQRVSAERRVVVASPLPAEGWQVDGSEG
jgi:hypothetical protein